jgi:hypothetical protein
MGRQTGASTVWAILKRAGIGVFELSRDGVIICDCV